MQQASAIERKSANEQTPRGGTGHKFAQNTSGIKKKTTRRYAWATSAIREAVVRTNPGRVVLAFALSLAFALAAGAARADDYPSHPIRLIVPYAAGGAAAAVARIIAKHVGESFGQPIVIENRGGAGAIIGT